MKKIILYKSIRGTIWEAIYEDGVYRLLVGTKRVCSTESKLKEWKTLNGLKKYVKKHIKNDEFIGEKGIKFF